MFACISFHLGNLSKLNDILHWIFYNIMQLTTPTINLSTKRLTWRLMLRQMRESIVHQTLLVQEANETKQIKSSDKWHCASWRYVISRLSRTKHHFTWSNKRVVDTVITTTTGIHKAGPAHLRAVWGPSQTAGRWSTGRWASPAVPRASSSGPRWRPCLTSAGISTWPPPGTAWLMVWNQQHAILRQGNLSFTCTFLW